MSSAGPAISDGEKTDKSDQLLHQIGEIQSKLIDNKNTSDNNDGKPEEDENKNEKVEDTEDKKEETENSNDNDDKSSQNENSKSPKDEDIDKDSNKDNEEIQSKLTDDKNTSDNNDEKTEGDEDTNEKIEDTEDKKDETENSNDNDDKSSQNENSESPKDEDLENDINKDNESETKDEDLDNDNNKDKSSQNENSESPKDEDFDNDNNKDCESETKESEPKDIDSYQTTDDLVSNTESLANGDSSHKDSESSNDDKNNEEDQKETPSDNDSKSNINPNILQQTNTIIKAIIDGVQSENDDKESTKDKDTTLEEENANESENQTKSETENTSENENKADEPPNENQNSNSDDDPNKNNSSHPLSNIFNSIAEQLQTDTVQITDAFSQTDPVPISVSCQTSFPPSEMESEIETETNNQNTNNREYQAQDIFASFNCRCTQTRKHDKTLSRSSELGSRSSKLYSRPRKTSQATKSKPVNRNNNNALLHLEISQPISPIQFRSSANSALSSNVASPRSSAASTISSCTEERSKNGGKKVQNIKNVLPNINSKSLISKTARPRVNNSGFSSSSGPEPTKTPNIKTGKLSMAKKGTLSNSKSCVLRRNINIQSNTTKIVLQSNKNNKKATKENILNDSVQETANDQLSSENSLQDEKANSINSTQKRKQSTESKQKKIDLDEQLTALTVNLLPGSLTSNTNTNTNTSTNSSSCKPKLTQKSATSNSIQKPKKSLNSMSKPPESTSATASTKSLGGTSQDKKENRNLSSSSSYKETHKLEIEEEEETTSVDDSEAPHIVKKRDYQGNTTEVNFTDHDSSSVHHSSSNKGTKTEEEGEFIEGENELTTTATDEESCSSDYEQMIDDLFNNILPSTDDDITSLYNYIKRRELDSIMHEDYTNCDRYHSASVTLVNTRNRSRFINEHYNVIENRLAKAESDLDSIQQLHRERLERFEYEREKMMQDLDKRQQQEVNNFESFWSSSRALVPFDKASSGLLDLRVKQKKSALIKEFSTAESMKKIADSIQVVEEDGATLSAESSMKIAFSQLMDRHTGQKAAFDQKMSRNRNFLNAEAESEIERQKLLIQQLEAKRDEKYDARARNDALSEMGFLSETVSPRTYETFTNYRKDPTASKLRLNSTTIVQTLHTKKQTKRPFTPGKTKRYGGYC